MKLLSLAVFVPALVVGLIIGSLIHLGEANAWLYGELLELCLEPCWSISSAGKHGPRPCPDPARAMHRSWSGMLRRTLQNSI